MLVRLLIAVVVLAALFIAYRGLLLWQARRARAQSSASGMPSIVYFTTATCAPCRTTITPALERLQAEMGAENLTIVRIDAEQQPELAARWGVMTVPTLFVLDGDGNPTRIYNGITSADSLRRDLRAARTA